MIQIGFSGVLRFLVLGFLCAAVAVGGTFLYAYSSVTKEIPEIKRVSDYRPLSVTQVVSFDRGQSHVMAEFYKERRYLTPYDQIPQKLIQAFLSAEDATFFEHQGVNLMAIMRAAFANFMAGKAVQGGSTITQQIAKSLYLSSEKRLLRKAKELFLTLQLEKHLTKEEILYLYLNQIYLGGGAYGVQAAAKTYFHKDIKKLTLAEAALIAGLPTAPGKFSPHLNPKKAKERQLYVLKRMKENKYITEAEQKAAALERIKVYVNEGAEKNVSPHFVEYIRRYLVQKFGEDAVYEEGLTVIVPVAVKSFEAARTALQTGLEDLDQRKGYRGPEKNVLQDEWDQMRLELKNEVVKEYYPVRVLTADGSLDLESVIQDIDPVFEKALSGKRVRALVTQISETKQIAYASIGLTSVQIPFENMKWAFRVGDEKHPPKSVGDVLRAGDVIWVKVLGYEKGSLKAKLMQIPELEGALYSVDAETGQILAMVGGYDFDRSQFNRAIQAKRQLGSTFKPIIYSAALERGYTPATIIVDSPIVFEDKDNGTWKPENFEERFYGDTTFRQALIDSRNIPTVKIVQDIRVSNVIQQAKRMGLEGPFNADLSISLGSAPGSVQDLVHTFTSFPLQGRTFRARTFQKIIDRDGRTLETERDLPVSQADLNEKVDANAPYAPIVPGLRLDPRVAYVMTHLMKEVVQFGTAARANSIGRPLAGKTGTTQDNHDAWFIGFSPRVVTGVWIGYDDQKPIGRGQTGANTALPIWMNYMANVLRDYPVEDFPIPEGISFVSIDPKTGKPSTMGRAIREAFISGTEPGVRQSAPVPASQKIKHVDEDVLREDD